MTNNRRRIFKTVRNAVAIAFWVSLVILCLVYRDSITVEAIVSFVPKSIPLTAAVLLLLFAVKSVSVFIYCGILYAASGLLLPLPLAILVNNLGNVIMATIPFWIGKKAGGNLVDDLLYKRPKLRFIKAVPNQNAFLTSFLVRIVNVLPSDIIGAYLGATGIGYRQYITGSLLGMLPQAVTFCIMGMSINDVSSPEFIISFALEVGMLLISVLICGLWMRSARKKARSKASQPEADPQA